MIEFGLKLSQGFIDPAEQSYLNVSSVLPLPPPHGSKAATCPLISGERCA